MVVKRIRASYLRARRAGYSGWLSFRINATTATSAVAAAMAGKAVVNPITVMVKRPALVNPKTVNTTPMNTIGGCTAAVYSDRRRTITTATNTPTVNPIRVPQPRAPTPNRSVSTPTAVNATANSTIGTGRHPVTDRNAAASATAGRRGAPAGTLLIPADDSQVEVWKPSWHGSTAPFGLVGGDRYLRMLTARATTRATVIRETADCSSMIIFAQRVSGIVSVGLKAVALVKETYR